MLVHPDDGVGSVFDSGREGVLRGQAVVDGDDDGVAFVHDRAAPTSVVRRGAEREATAVEVDHDRIASRLARDTASPA